MTTTALEPPISVGALAEAVSFLVTPPAFEVRPPTVSGARYRSSGHSGIAPLADVYLPQGPGPHPSTVLVHGGGFVIGSRGMKPMRYLAGELCQAGWAVATFDYRMLFRGGRLDQAVEDVQAMFDWWAEQADRFDLDPARITTAGLSAGATLMLLAAGASQVEFSHVVSVFGVYDFSALPGRIPQVLTRLLTRSRDPGVWRGRSPLEAAPVRAPMTLIHGTFDRLIPVRQAEDYAAARRAQGLSTELHVYEGAPHGFFNDARSPHSQRGIADLLTALG